MKTFTLSPAAIALNHATRTSKSPSDLCRAIHFNGDHLVATNGYIMAILPKANNATNGPENLNINLQSVKPGKNPTEITETDAGRFIHASGQSEIIDGTFPAYKQVTPTVTPDTHYAIAINAELLMTLTKAIRNQSAKGAADKIGANIVTLFISKTSPLDAVGVLSSGEAAGVIVPCCIPANFNRYNAITGKGVK